MFSIGDAPISLDESTDEEQFWRTAVTGVTSDCTKNTSGKSWIQKKLLMLSHNTGTLALVSKDGMSNGPLRLYRPAALGVVGLFPQDR